MKKLKRFMALAAAFCMFSVSAYAETKDVSYKVTVDSENVSVATDSLTSDTDDFVFRIREISASGTIGTVYITKGQYLPQSVYRTVELYDADGELQQKTKNYMSVSSSGSEISFTMPSGYVCGEDGSYVVLSLYEREDEQQLLSRITIKPSYFDLSSFN